MVLTAYSAIKFVYWKKVGFSPPLRKYLLLFGLNYERSVWHLILKITKKAVEMCTSMEFNKFGFKLSKNYCSCKFGPVELEL